MKILYLVACFVVIIAAVAFLMGVLSEPLGAPSQPSNTTNSWPAFPRAISNLPLTYYEIPEPEAKLTLPAWLSTPAGTGPFPVVIMMSGSNGLWGATGPLGNTPSGWEQYQTWTEWFVSQGYATLIIDSFTPRGIQEASGKAARAADSAPPSGEVLMQDYYAAAFFLTDVGIVDAQKIAIMGDSLSAGAVLRASEDTSQTRGLQAQLAQKGGRIAAAVALYPGCSAAVSSMFTVPVLISVGLKDENIKSPQYCQDLGNFSRRSGAPVTVVMYPNATHVYDVDKPSRTMTAGGVTYHLAYDAEATADTKSRILSFLRQYLVPGTPTFTGERSTLIYSTVQ